MGSQLNGSGAYESDSVIAFVPTAKSTVSKDADQLDAAGQTILSLLHKAAGMAEENSKHALDLAQKLSHQLRAAETRVAGLEAQVRYYQDKTERSEQWLHKIYSEIEERFFRAEDKRGGVNSLERPSGRRA
jgi:septal ring factor EnvC (AmiA/AmiB activator)